MEKPADIETKYQKLATEFSKVRSQATVLKKGLLDEQARNLQLNEVVKIHEQTIRKHGQEMESLTFRNEQLTKRISVLQQELQVNNNSKKSKNKSTPESAFCLDVSVLDEELQKKILENAQLVNSVTDKDVEISESREKIQWLETRISNLQKKLTEEASQKEDILKVNRSKSCVPSSEVMQNSSVNNCGGSIEKVNYWKDQAEKWRNECEVLRSKPNSNEQLSEYYDKQLKEAVEEKLLAQSETKSLWAENMAFKARLENLTLENNRLKNYLDKINEELKTTNENYKSQLDALTEHLAAQNEKITKQCDEIQLLKHMLSIKK